jgi:uncharacterized damage-inducible protein DinB
MHTRILAATLAVAIVPTFAAAQDSPAVSVQVNAAPVANPVSNAFRANAQYAGKNLMAAADDMPADRYGFKPTAAQMSFADIMVHLARGNDFLCGVIGGAKAPQRSNVGSGDSKDALGARLKETFAFCDQALASLDDSKLAEAIPVFGKTMSRAAVETLTVGDWADHYSQVAIYMRLNGQLPPTAKKPGA